ncbi:hypothetical protein [Marinomonas sp. GJ51-6]|uniref:putative quinol monooxygenase n=1 Tax=Marinomonas sp. GJ51-6 TaxID=2992802 RepID=UPI002934F043|nr:hypothetical protein [Marinomonas sp. GJ51-6]WOD08582.1 hypothetical protein ONZ50_05725 [Marinomonas sp. GJ51-6]
MNKIKLSGYIEVPREDLEAVEGELPNHIALTHQEAGCITFTVTQDTDKPVPFRCL